MSHAPVVPPHGSLIGQISTCEPARFQDDGAWTGPIASATPTN
jgi:hypothetical protein